MKEVVQTFYNQYTKGILKVESSSIEKFSRKSLTGELAELIKTLATN